MGERERNTPSDEGATERPQRWPTRPASDRIGDAMLSRAQEARVREVLGNHPPGVLAAYCVEHLAASAQIPPAHIADLAAFVRSLRAYGGCQTRYGGVCDAGAHETRRLLVTGPTSEPMARPSTGTA